METGRTEPSSSIWPREILSLPRVVIPVSGVTGYCLRNDDRQVVFFEMDEGTSFPDHNHCEQWGTVVAGEMTLEIGGHTDLYQQGETYHIPEGASHRASFSERTYLIDLFASPDRYPVQP